MNQLTGSGSIFEGQALVAKVTYSLIITPTNTGQDRINGSIRVIEGGEDFQIQKQLVLFLNDHKRKFQIQFKRPHPPIIDPNYQIIINREILD